MVAKVLKLAIAMKEVMREREFAYVMIIQFLLSALSVVNVLIQDVVIIQS